MIQNNHIPTPGNLVKARGREWIVMPSEDQDPDVVMVKPLGGSEAEKTGILMSVEGTPKRYELPLPEEKDLNPFENARLLFHAAKLSFRHASGPFRCMARLNFRPRPYQLVPLLMALKQEVARLLIADDVGVGKTVEALLIVKEWLERAEVKRFAIICPPHLCEQWQRELLDKVGIEATIIRGSTVARLERNLRGDQTIFDAHPYQIISIDYIKGEKRRGIFKQQAPEMIIVDEAHTCARPAGQRGGATQQQRYYLLSQLAQNPNRHLLLLTATPHSGKEQEFRSLLGLLHPDLETLDIGTKKDTNRRRMASYFVQRKRKDILRWVGKDTHFARRVSQEIGVSLSREYLQVYTDVQQVLRSETEDGARYQHWAALALLRGIMSSPAAGVQMLQNRQAKGALEVEINIEPGQESVDGSDRETDAPFSLTLSEKLDVVINRVQALSGPEKDLKLARTMKQVTQWVQTGVCPIIFCRYIKTAEYVGQYLREALPKQVAVRVVTSELADEQRKEKIDELGQEAKRVLVCTDCLSEGINLQEHFTAVLHYDLPWNPNRIEQREGRVDRYGQAAKEVFTTLLYGQGNPMDELVLSVLIRKMKVIASDIGVKINMGDAEESLMDMLIRGVLQGQASPTTGHQMSLMEVGGILKEENDRITQQINEAAEKSARLHSIFSHSSVKEPLVAECLREVDEAIGDQHDVEQFVTTVLPYLGGNVHPDEQGYQLQLGQLPYHLQVAFEGKKTPKISFRSPCPEGYQYLGRNHPWVTLLCQEVMGRALEPKNDSEKIGRAAVLRTTSTQHRTILIQFRVRNLLERIQGKHQMLAEEMYLYGWRILPDGRKEVLHYAEAKALISEARTAINLPAALQCRQLNFARDEFITYKNEFDALAAERANHLVGLHDQFKELVKGPRYQAAMPVLPPDVLGMYVLLPHSTH